MQASLLRWVSASLLVSGLLHCAKQPSAHLTWLEQAQQAERGRSYEAARAAWKQAAEEAPTERERHEALYRQASSYLSEERWEEAATALQEYVAQFPQAERAARALLAAGRARERAEQLDAARAVYFQLVLQYPASGNAQDAALRYVALSSGSKETTLRELLTRVHEPELRHGLHYSLARTREEHDPRGALLLYERLVSERPFPQGVYSDDALLRAARIRRALGDPEGALLTLALLLETAPELSLVGSLNRESYEQARWLRFEIHLQDLQLRAPASRELDELIQNHPHSRLLGQAMFQQAALAFQAGKLKRACKMLQQLHEQNPESRWARCLALYCQTDPASLPRHCCQSLPQGAQPSLCDSTDTLNPEQTDEPSSSHESITHESQTQIKSE